MPLAPLREQFDIPAGLIYLDGNSLGVLPRTAAARVQQVVQQEWGTGLIGSWNSAGWMDLPQRVGDKIARLVGAGPGELVVADSTSVNLFKVLSAALNIAAQRRAARARASSASAATSRPTCTSPRPWPRERGLELVLVDAPEQLAGALDARCAVLMLTHVNYRTGRMHDMAALTRAAHAAGALALWDLAHSAGAVPVDLSGSGADFAVGCGYKYLNGGPGAPAFVWVAPAACRALLAAAGRLDGACRALRVHARLPAGAGHPRYLCGTPPVLSLAALECGVDTVLAAEALGGMAALRSKSLALTEAFAALVEATLRRPRPDAASRRDDAAQRGSQVCLAHPTHGYADGAGADRARRGRRLPRARTSCASASRRCTRASSMSGTPSSICARCSKRGEWQQARFNQRAAVT